MDAIIDFLIPFSYVGMFVAAFIAGSVFPFSSEALLAGLQLAGLHPILLFVSATVGNTLGSIFNYTMGHLGRIEWIEQYLHVQPEKIEKARNWLNRGGAWMGFFCFIPVLGSLISVTLGLMRANVYISCLSIFLGKSLRYAFLIWLIELIE